MTQTPAAPAAAPPLDPTPLNYFLHVSRAARPFDDAELEALLVSARRLR